jgi:hypothetical protein
LIESAWSRPFTYVYPLCVSESGTGIHWQALKSD